MNSYCWSGLKLGFVVRVEHVVWLEEGERLTPSGLSGELWMVVAT